jgi:hypothetical protein
MEPRGVLETPALLKRTSSRDSAVANLSTAGLIVVKSSSERWRNLRSPSVEVGLGKTFIFAIAAKAFASDLPAR